MSVRVTKLDQHVWGHKSLNLRDMSPAASRISVLSPSHSTSTTSFVVSEKNIVKRSKSNVRDLWLAKELEWLFRRQCRPLAVIEHREGVELWLVQH